MSPRWRHEFWSLTSCTGILAVVRFRAKERTQEVPFVTLAAFKHHVQNITRLGKVIFVLRKCLQWIENQEDEIHDLSSIFLWKTGLLEFADEIRSQTSSVRVCRRVIEKLGSITRRLPTANQEPAFEVRALVTIKDTAGLRQTLMDYFKRSVPQATVQRPALSASCATTSTTTPLSHSQSFRVPRTQLYYPRHGASLRLPSKSSARSALLPPDLKESLENWLREYPGKLDCTAVEKFNKWMQETQGSPRRLARLTGDYEDCDALLKHENMPKLAKCDASGMWY
ncbi:unnamed protein product [Schistocephalus solidus]|uniref:Uncharacterized protein n=1 Tax=Schistocephalus solidus TaxID=70667 RepID=A0A183SIR8_SCHSO|nr:unnamed protein product [Schistocephalus solidus]